MEVPMVNALLLVTILFFLINFKQVFSQFHYVGHYCDSTMGNYTNKNAFKNNLDLLLPNLTRQASKSLFNTYSVGRGMEKAYGLYLCRGDLNDTLQCHDCVDSAITALSETCPYEIETFVWYQECLVRYSNRSLSNYEDESLLLTSWSIANVTDPENFETILVPAMNDTIVQAAYNATKKGFATAEAELTLLETVYIMGICTPDIVGSLCERCLRVGLSRMMGRCGTSRVSLEIYLPSCWLRYDAAPFIMTDAGVEPPTSPRSPTQTSDPEEPADLPPPPPYPLWIYHGMHTLTLRPLY